MTNIYFAEWYCQYTNQKRRIEIWEAGATAIGALPNDYTYYEFPSAAITLKELILNEYDNFLSGLSATPELSFTVNLNLLSDYLDRFNDLKKILLFPYRTLHFYLGDIDETDILLKSSITHNKDFEVSTVINLFHFDLQGNKVHDFLGNVSEGINGSFSVSEKTIELKAEAVWRKALDMLNFNSMYMIYADDYTQENGDIIETVIPVLIQNSFKCENGDARDLIYFINQLYYPSVSGSKETKYIYIRNRFFITNYIANYIKILFQVYTRLIINTDFLTNTNQQFIHLDCWDIETDAHYWHNYFDCYKLAFIKEYEGSETDGIWNDVGGFYSNNDINSQLSKDYKNAYDYLNDLLKQYLLKGVFNLHYRNTNSQDYLLILNFEIAPIFFDAKDNKTIEIAGDSVIDFKYALYRPKQITSSFKNKFANNIDSVIAQTDGNGLNKVSESVTVIESQFTDDTEFRQLFGSGKIDIDEVLWSYYLYMNHTNDVDYSVNYILSSHYNQYSFLRNIYTAFNSDKMTFVYQSWITRENQNIFVKAGETFNYYLTSAQDADSLVSLNLPTIPNFDSLNSLYNYSAIYTHGQALNDYGSNFPNELQNTTSIGLQSAQLYLNLFNKNIITFDIKMDLMPALLISEPYRNLLTKYSIDLSEIIDSYIIDGQSDKYYIIKSKINFTDGLVIFTVTQKPS